MQSLLTMAQDGGLDGALLATRQFYQTDYTKPVLFLAGGSYFEDQASARNLLGEQWGMMNETGNWPGQAWLWLYTVWVPGAAVETRPATRTRRSGSDASTATDSCRNDITEQHPPLPPGTR